MFGGRKLAVRRAHAKWSRLRKRVGRRRSEDSIAVKRAHARWSCLREENFHPQSENSVAVRRGHAKGSKMLDGWSKD